MRCPVQPPPASHADDARYELSLVLTHTLVSWLNRIARPRTSVRINLGDKPLSVRLERLVWQEEPSPISMLDCVWGVEDDAIVLSIPHALAEAVISTVQSGLALFSEPSRSLVLELALEPLLARLESETQQRLQLLHVGKAETKGPYIEFDIIYGPVRGKGRLFLFSPLAGPMPPAFHALGELLGQLPREMRKLSTDLPVIVAGEIGALRASASLLRKTRAGDALLPEVMPFARGQIILTAGRLWTAADVTGNRLTLRGPFHSRPRPLEFAYMTTQPGSQQPPSEADLNDIEISLVFECGRWPITLGALRSIGEGHVFELGRPIDGPVDILANGVRIGRGDIVRIGDELGIRLRGGLAGHD
ncbi:type III secretion system cytoplasmic ring protein SctQ [Bradyrhizobium sp. Pa8]|uniref:type III secretion system cytoplasmic ring protein SctQ n=1 Tax=Bradyrhizobium sp. Pa8 TaxID=3386552 RepID=UPI00403EFDBE